MGTVGRALHPVSADPAGGLPNVTFFGTIGPASKVPEALMVDFSTLSVTDVPGCRPCRR